MPTGGEIKTRNDCDDLYVPTDGELSVSRRDFS